jgi:hypothetical protein
MARMCHVKMIFALRHERLNIVHISLDHDHHHHQPRCLDPIGPFRLLNVVSSLVFQFFNFPAHCIAISVQVFGNIPFFVNAVPNYFCNVVFLYLGQKHLFFPNLFVGLLICTPVSSRFTKMYHLFCLYSVSWFFLTFHVSFPYVGTAIILYNFSCNPSLPHPFTAILIVPHISLNCVIFHSIFCPVQCVNLEPSCMSYCTCSLGWSFISILDPMDVFP